MQRQPSQERLKGLKVDSERQNERQYGLGLVGPHPGCLGNSEVACILGGSQYEELGYSQRPSDVYKVLQNIPL